MAAVYCLPVNVLWGTNYIKGECSDPLKKEKRRKSDPWRSFTPELEINIEEQIFTNPEQPGDQMALMLMWAFGLRNNEACGLVYGDIIPITEHPGEYRLAILKSTDGETHEPKGGGKNSNVYRYIPIPARVFSFLMCRKSYIQNLIETGEIVFTASDRAQSIEELPIACNRKRYKEHCSSRQVTDAGRQLFSKIDMSEDESYWLSRYLLENDIPGQDKDDPTAYAFRRNFATTMDILGFSLCEMQYLMGHKMKDEDNKRYFFANPDVMDKLYRKMSQRPLVNSSEIWCNNKSLEEYKKECTNDSVAYGIYNYHNYYKHVFEKKNGR